MEIVHGYVPLPEAISCGLMTLLIPLKTREPCQFTPSGHSADTSEDNKDWLNNGAETGDMFILHEF